MSDAAFVGSVPDLYERYLTPFLAPFARDLASRVGAQPPRRMLELACGTGLLTRELVPVMNGSSLVATDLNAPMIDIAKRLVASPKVTWQPASAMALPFPDRAFDLVVCQFGVMFFPDKVAGAREIRRVLAPGGTFLFNTWAVLEENPLGRLTHETVTQLFPSDPPTFMRVPFGYGDAGAIRSDLLQGGFDDVTIELMDLVGRSPSARETAIGIVEGNPIVLAIQERGSVPVAAVTEAVARRFEEIYGSGEVCIPTRAFVVTAR